MQKLLTIVQQNDTHGVLTEHPELFWGGNGPFIRNVGGFAKMAQFVKELRSKNENVLFVDGGDLFHGTAPLVFSKGEAILPLLEKMSLDAVVPGNWDFAYGKEQLLTLTEKLPFSTLACNVLDQQTKKPIFAPYEIKEIGEVKAGLIGLTYPYVNVTMPASFSTGLVFNKGINQLPNIIQQLKAESVDVIILISHMGLPLDVKLASLVSGIDVILSGHSHDRVMKPIVENQTVIVQAGSSSSFVGRLDIGLENSHIAAMNYQLVPLESEDYQGDGEISSLTASILAPYESMQENRIGATKTLLHRGTLNEAPMDKLITEAYLHQYEADLAFSHGWRYGTPIPPGPVTEYDLFQIIPANPEIFLVELSGEQLIKALETNLEQVFSADPFEQKGGYILRSSGMSMTFKPYNPKGHRIQTLSINGREFKREDRYKIVSAGEQILKKFENAKTYQNTKAIDVLKEFFRMKNTIELDLVPKISSV
ncbi:bifunctional metallophosphatase/5'-nucleotidase [Neobacillus sp. SM06]|uniref:bifunctional metallophosphatase/5'-nucleotidase n=1 Tax=Neobacillus sp. SM06 TaxID=3422492 RepID=UPI003D2BE842